ncbi:hypothetical protein EB796_008500 [Bugula neritina]|uniref:Uncharacterized protein n=1 Tax=Bugula neritina TaxID=10212 RepID=A0A7J7K5I1_BUGNE|nr:hypothetical protein EB796_008500 [Bugula neritina]
MKRMRITVYAWISQHTLLYCYKCDEYVVNDSDAGSIQSLRNFFQQLDPNYHLLDIENDKNHSRKRSGNFGRSQNYKKRKPIHLNCGP